MPSDGTQAAPPNYRDRLSHYHRAPAAPSQGRVISPHRDSEITRWPEGPDDSRRAEQQPPTAGRPAGARQLRLGAEGRELPQPRPVEGCLRSWNAGAPLGRDHPKRPRPDGAPDRRAQPDRLAVDADGDLGAASRVTRSAVSVVRPVPCPRRRSSIACRAPPELPEYNSTTWAVKHPGPMICRRAGGSHEDDLQNESGWAACGPPLGIPHITSAARNPGAMRSAAAKPSFDACARRHLAERRNHRGISCWLYKDGAFYDHNTGGVIWRQALSGQRPGDDAFHRNAGMLAVRDPATGYIDGAGRRSRVCGRPLVLRGHARLHATMDTLAHSAGKTVTGVQNPARGSKGRRRAFVAGALRGCATVAADVACLTRRR